MRTNKKINIIDKTASIQNDIINAIKLTVSYKNKKVGLHEPILTDMDMQYVNKAIKSGYVSSVGKYVNDFENTIKKYTKSKYAIAIVNGTNALHLSLLACDVSNNDEVLVPSLTFVATANAISYCNAKPHFIDTCPETLQIDYQKLESYLSLNTITKKGVAYNKKTNQRIKAIVPVHLYGHPDNIEKLLEISKKYNLRIVEDATEGLGSFYKKRHVGNFGDAGVISFNGNKIITTGGGGMVITNNKRIAETVRHLSTTAKVKHKWEYIHDTIGYNYRMPNLNAALGLSQLKLLKKSLNRKRKIFTAYKKNFSKIKEVTIVKEPAKCISNYWLQTILLRSDYSHIKETVIDKTNNLKIVTRPAWKLLNKMECYKKNPSMNLDGAESLVKRIINLPSNFFYEKD